MYKLFTDIRTARPSQDVRVINMLLQFLMAAYNGENLCFLDRLANLRVMDRLLFDSYHRALVVYCRRHFAFSVQ